MTLSSGELAVKERRTARTREITIDNILDIDYQESIADKLKLFQKAATEYMARHPGEPIPEECPPSVEKIMNTPSRHVRCEGIVIKTKQGMYMVGVGLPEDETAYLVQTIREKMKEMGGFRFSIPVSSKEAAIGG